MFDGADTVVLYEELAFQDVLPIVWRQMPNPADRDMAAGFTERNLLVRQAWDARDEHGPGDKPDENAPYAADIMRLELKINLLLDMAGQLLAANRPRPPAVPVRFNALGGMWRGTAPLPEAGQQGVAEIYLHDALAQPLRLPGRVTNVTPDGQVSNRLTDRGEAHLDLPVRCDVG